MKTFVDPNDFPAAQKFAYLNAASVAMMYKEGVERCHRMAKGHCRERHHELR